eukprot:946571-Pleurochrysis_carterae.AAC.1
MLAVACTRQGHRCSLRDPQRVQVRARMRSHTDVSKASRLAIRPDGAHHNSNHVEEAERDVRASLDGSGSKIDAPGKLRLACT